MDKYRKQIKEEEEAMEKETSPEGAVETKEQTNSSTRSKSCVSEPVTSISTIRSD